MAKKIGKDKKNANQLREQLPDTLSKDDLAALDAFCAFEIEEIGFESWCGVHESLNLQLTLELSAEEANIGGTKEINFTRSTKVAPKLGQPKPPPKSSVCQLVEFPAGIKAGETLRIKGAGDRREDQCGDLLVIIKVL